MKFSTQFSKVEVIQGSSFIQWRKQSLSDVKSLNTKYVMLYLEDHMLGEAPPDASELIKELSFFKADIFQYSWYPQYSQLRKNLNEVFQKTSRCGIYAEIDKTNQNLILNTEFPWIVSMTSIFDYDFLIKLLKSDRPFLRKFDPRAPYEIEQPPKSNWYLPVVYGLCKHEMGICLDDDNSVFKSSAISRGLYLREKSEVGLYHNGKFSPANLMRQASNSLIGKKVKNALPRSARIIFKTPIRFIGYLIYSIETLLFCLIDFITEIRINFTKK
jgi:hypothetical protein